MVWRPPEAESAATESGNGAAGWPDADSTRVSRHRQARTAPLASLHINHYVTSGSDNLRWGGSLLGENFPTAAT